MTDKATLVKQFKALGIKEGMTLLVHSSLRRVGKVDGGADTIIDALLEVLGENGTLLMSGVLYYFPLTVSPGQSIMPPNSTILL